MKISAVLSSLLAVATLAPGVLASSPLFESSTGDLHPIEVGGKCLDFDDAKDILEWSDCVKEKTSQYFLYYLDGTSNKLASPLAPGECFSAHPTTGIITSSSCSSTSASSWMLDNEEHVTMSGKCLKAVDPPPPSPAPTNPPTNPPTSPPTNPPTDAPVAVTEAPKFKRRCHVCGDRDLNTWCEGMDMIFPPVEDCPGDKNYCITDVDLSLVGPPKFRRRCANENRCHKDWWESTSDLSLCVDGDPTTVQTDAICSYCCTTDECNIGVVPDESTFYEDRRRRLTESDAKAVAVVECDDDAAMKYSPSHFELPLMEFSTSDAYQITLGGKCLDFDEAKSMLVWSDCVEAKASQYFFYYLDGTSKKLASPQAPGECFSADPITGIITSSSCSGNASSSWMRDGENHVTMSGKCLKAVPAPTSAPTDPPTNPPTEAPTPAPVVKIEKSVNRKCGVCGDPDIGIPCTALEFISTPEVECPHNMNYCMSSVEVFQDGRPPFLTKKCVDQDTCMRKWWKETSDLAICTDQDPTQVVADFTCNYCCTSDNCNKEGSYNRMTDLFSVRRRLTESDVKAVAVTECDDNAAMYFDDETASDELTDTDDVTTFEAVTDDVTTFEAWTDDILSDQAPGQVVTSQAVLHMDKNQTAENLKASANGDPHFSLFNGDKYDFHGGCDLVLLKNEGFVQPMRVHIRTKIDTWWSFIETAALQLGTGILEVTGGNDGGSYWLNGQPGQELKDDDSFELSGFLVHFHKVSAKQKRFRIELGNGDAMSIETYKDFVSVHVQVKTRTQFESTVGLMGSFPSGTKLARDRTTEVEDANAFGQEWQVLETEPMLFHSVEGTQHPTACAMPEETTADGRKKRRLGESQITTEQAELACARAAENGHFDACVFDVLATNDDGIAAAY